LLVGGCSSTVEGEAFPVDVIGMFDPCEVLSNEELERVGVDPATKEARFIPNARLLYLKAIRPDVFVGTEAKATAL